MFTRVHYVGVSLLPSSDQLKLINLRVPLLRALLIAPALAAIMCAWFAARWYVGNTMSPYAIAAGADNGLDIARVAARLAPDDPQTHWSLAEIEKRGFTPEALNASVKEYEESVSRSPNDYRLWMDLGRAREQAGDAARGEQALQRAVELAPSYALPRWHLGNALVRHGKFDDGLAELRLAASRDQTLRGNVFDLAWGLYDGDVQAISEKLGDSPAARAQLTGYLLGRTRLEDALRLWDSLNPSEKRNEHATGESLMNALEQAKRYRAAIELYAAFASEGAYIPQIGQIQNGGFESDKAIVTGGAMTGANAFSWNIQSVPQAQAAIDARIHQGGARSLRVVFNARTNLSFNNISQLVAVDPGARYRFQCNVRTKDLKSAGTPILEIVSALDNSVLGASSPLPVGTSEWQQVTIDFATNPKTEGIILRTNRAACSTVDAVCPIFGIVWYDDFNLQRLGGGSGSNAAKR